MYWLITSHNAIIATPSLPYLGWVSWRGGGGTVVMKDHHDEKPVTAAEVPDNPVDSISAEDCG